MNPTVEIFTFSKEVPCADADGHPIHEGSVLKHITDGERGVVVDIKRKGDVGFLLDAIGDIHIRTSPGCTRCTNQYAAWRHIPHNDQTYSERLLSWEIQPYEYDEYRPVSRDEAMAIDGIIALLPDDIVDWDYEWVNNTVDALRILVRHLSNIQKKEVKNEK